MLDPIVKTLVVPCGQQMAFEVFIEQMPSWWPLDMFSVSAKSKKPAKGLRVDARNGGWITEIGHDDTEHHWGTITAYAPFDRLAFDFHIAEPATSASRVVVRFTSRGARSTHVELVQSNWEAFGKKAPWMRDGYEKGWSIIFDQRYLAACSS